MTRSDDPRDILRWAFDTIDRVAIACSFQMGGLVLAHMARGIVPRVPVLFLQTGFHFSETLEMRDRIVREWDLDLIQTRPWGADEELWRTDPDACCRFNKVLPLQTALEGLDGWITGVRRDQGFTRREVRAVERQRLQFGREIWKVAPLVAWTKAQVERYTLEHGIPRHPLYAKGFTSIGCEPCTRATRAGEHERAGRWDGIGKTECGIHSS